MRPKGLWGFARMNGLLILLGLLGIGCDGLRVPLIAVSPFAKQGLVDHTYAHHASIVKFIERNWALEPLSGRSRDNLPNPVRGTGTPYFPANSPAIGDLMSLFDFTQ